MLSITQVSLVSTIKLLFVNLSIRTREYENSFTFPVFIPTNCSISCMETEFVSSCLGLDKKNIQPTIFLAVVKHCCLPNMSFLSPLRPFVWAGFKVFGQVIKSGAIQKRSWSNSSHYIQLDGLCLQILACVHLAIHCTHPWMP